MVVTRFDHFEQRSHLTKTKPVQPPNVTCTDIALQTIDTAHVKPLAH